MTKRKSLTILLVSALMSTFALISGHFVYKSSPQSTKINGQVISLSNIDNSAQPKEIKETAAPQTSQTLTDDGSNSQPDAVSNDKESVEDKSQSYQTSAFGTSSSVNPLLLVKRRGRSCTQSTKRCVPCKKGELYCRYESSDKYGYLGWACQNNNPSNIRSSDYRANIIKQKGGPRPCGAKGGFFVFSTYKQGRKGVKAYIRGIDSGLHSSYPKCTTGDCSLLYFFSRYAPNNPEGYTDGIISKMKEGVKRSTKLRWIVNNRLTDFVDAIQCMEGYFITQDGQTVKWCRL